MPFFFLLILIAVIYLAAKGAVGITKFVWFMVKVLVAILIIKLILIFFGIVLFGSLAAPFLHPHPYW